MAEFTWNPSRGFTGETTPRINVAKFGDGYAQRTTSGINTLDRTWSLQFQQNSLTDVANIEAFFKARKGVTPFSWLPPGESTEVKVVCTKWSKTYDSHISATINATFELVYGY